MARTSAKSTATADAAPDKTDVAPAKENPGRDLLELRLRWKIINETVEAGIVERKRLREAIDSLTREMQQHKAEG
jgi:hypothetical protein